MLSCIAAFIFSVCTIAVPPVCAAPKIPDVIHGYPQTHAAKLPCSVVLNPVKNIPNARGAAVFYDVKQKYAENLDQYLKKTAVSIVAHQLPAPSSFGDHDTYEGFVQVPGIISWRVYLESRTLISLGMTAAEAKQIPANEYTWAGSYVGITASLPKETKIQVRLSNSKTDKLGPAVLEGTFESCKQ